MMPVVKALSNRGFFFLLSLAMENPLLTIQNTMLAYSSAAYAANKLLNNFKALSKEELEARRSKFHLMDKPKAYEQSAI